jgi:hypothetical protein
MPNNCMRGGRLGFVPAGDTRCQLPLIAARVVHACVRRRQPFVGTGVPETLLSVATGLLCTVHSPVVAVRAPGYVCCRAVCGSKWCFPAHGTDRCWRMMRRLCAGRYTLPAACASITCNCLCAIPYTVVCCIPHDVRRCYQPAFTNAVRHNAAHPQMLGVVAARMLCCDLVQPTCVQRASYRQPA